MIKFNSNTLIVDDKNYQFDYQILNVVNLDDKIIILFNALENVADFTKLSNIWAFDCSGKRIWIAQEPPPHFKGDYYTTIYEENRKLIAHSFGTFMCTLDTETGKILESVMTK